MFPRINRITLFYAYKLFCSLFSKFPKIVYAYPFSLFDYHPPQILFYAEMKTIFEKANGFSTFIFKHSIYLLNLSTYDINYHTVQYGVLDGNENVVLDVWKE